MMRYFICPIFCLLLIIPTLSYSTPIQIDPAEGSLPGNIFPSPFTSFPVKYSFINSRTWTDDEKKVIREAFYEWDVWICNTTTFVETTGNDWDISLRWAGSDLFKDWRDDKTFTEPGWNLSNTGPSDSEFGPLAITVKPKGRNPNTTPWDDDTYPSGEIYFNEQYFNTEDENRRWFVDKDPKTDESFKGFDLLTVAKHEIGHMLSIKGDWKEGTPNKSSDEVMWYQLDSGQRKHLKPSDLAALREAGYHVVPEPSTLLYLSLGLLGIFRLRRKRFLKKV